VDAGHPEIVLTGINVGCYGFEGKQFIDVVKSLLDLDGLARLRISSIEPTTVGAELLGLMADNPKLCRHLHLPLQSGCDSVLKRMNRRYDVSEYADFLNRACETIPNICLGADVMVVFPGETDEEYQTSEAFVDGLPLSYLHVFSYSTRKNAKASRMDLKEVDSRGKKARSEALRLVGDTKRAIFFENQIGTVATVLAEQCKNGAWNGLTDNFIRVHFEADGELSGTFATVRLDAAQSNAMRGTLA
jgi:threonylcarbamoyladenosine tRNA methylthiotransferase MtaB